jgi:hypothetical protein
MLSPMGGAIVAVGYWGWLLLHTKIRWVGGSMSCRVNESPSFSLALRKDGILWVDFAEMRPIWFTSFESRYSLYPKVIPPDTQDYCRLWGRDITTLSSQEIQAWLFYWGHAFQSTPENCIRNHRLAITSRIHNGNVFCYELHFGEMA